MIREATSPYDERHVPSSLRLNLFEDATFDAVLTDLVHHRGTLVWQGAIAGEADSEVRLAVRGDAVTGMVRAGTRFFTIQPRPGGALVLANLALMAFYRLDVIAMGVKGPELVQTPARGAADAALQRLSTRP